VEIRRKSVKKTYLVERVRHLENIYKALKDKDVPHVDRLAHLIDATIYLEPKRIDTRPSNQEELLQAITCILEALVVCIIFQTNGCRFPTYIPGSSSRPTAIS
jgi:hypothetical protein